MKQRSAATLRNSNIYKQNFRYWTEKGICWARNSNVQDIDDTAMGFRLLRLHGYQVSAGKCFNWLTR